jgi:hypothetical protein
MSVQLRFRVDVNSVLIQHRFDLYRIYAHIHRSVWHRSLHRYCWLAVSVESPKTNDVNDADHWLTHQIVSATVWSTDRIWINPIAILVQITFEIDTIAIDCHIAHIDESICWIVAYRCVIVICSVQMCSINYWQYSLVQHFHTDTHCHIALLVRLVPERIAVCCIGQISLSIAESSQQQREVILTEYCCLWIIERVIATTIMY